MKAFAVLAMLLSAAITPAKDGGCPLNEKPVTHCVTKCQYNPVTHENVCHTECTTTCGY